MSPSKKLPIEEGDIFAIPLEDQKLAAGIVLHVSKYFAGSVLVGYFDRCFCSVEDIVLEDLKAQFAFTPNYTGRPAATIGEWFIVGNRRDLVKESSIPKLVVATDVFFKDEVIERLPTLEAAKQYEPVRGQGKAFVENKLRAYFQSKECESAGKAGSET